MLKYTQDDIKKLRITDYIVKKGDSLSKIAKELYGDSNAEILKKINPNTNVYSLKIGQKINVWE